MNTAVFHLPGLFEFTELYRRFLPLFYGHREYFYDWCAIGSIYGAPADCLWGGGRVGFGEADADEVLSLVRAYGISPRLTFSNSLLRPEHLSDKRCNDLCARFSSSGLRCGIIIHSDLLLDYLRRTYPGFYYVSSTTKVLTDIDSLVREAQRPEFDYVVPDFRLNRQLDRLNTLTPAERGRLELLCNECCAFGCRDRRACYEAVSRKSLGEEGPEHICRAPGSSDGYRFSRAMENPGFIGTEDIVNTYLPMGISQFKLEGRGLGSAVVLEMLLYYLTKPRYQLRVREEIYLDGMLDLF